jgi:hypothetical protein
VARVFHGLSEVAARVAACPVEALAERHRPSHQIGHAEKRLALLDE